MAHHTVRWKILLVKVDQELLRLESKLLVHDLEAEKRTINLVNLKQSRRIGRESKRGKRAYHGWIVGTDMKCDIAAIGSLHQMIKHEPRAQKLE